MLTRILFLMTLGLGITVFLTGAWTGSFAPAARSPEAAFLPLRLDLDDDVVGTGLDAQAILARAIAKLAAQRTTWLKTNIRQTLCESESKFVAEGFLQRGPRHCVRLEMTIVNQGKTGSLLLVSDGDVLAQVRRLPNDAPAVLVEPLPDASNDAKEEYLDGKGCGGPSALLREFQRHLRNGKLQTGMLQDQAVIRIQGELPAGPTPAFAFKKTPIRHACVYLDAATLWPIRLEWWSADPASAPRPVLRIEFLEPEIDRALAFEECVRMFSYHPDGAAPP